MKFLNIFSSFLSCEINRNIIKDLMLYIYTFLEYHWQKEIKVSVYTVFSDKW